MYSTGIPRFTLLMWGQIKKKRGKQKPCKSRLLSSTKGEENRIVINRVKSKIEEIETKEIEECLSGSIGGKTSKTSVLPGFSKVERGGGRALHFYGSLT